ncbi:formylglycine-generating enzyme family protein [Candidatus Thiodictyon syntrophicum]|jgi:formylglycine-generating enzyme required for sulfatase activity|uniref:Sulfatase-modifying factor protein n=1 Tax=Candidatus Thiodictyon syntrophicum TaxID=1166950 RepID=A0A2K8UB88_9GAMM|nr:formylglycine-generating enzyme family protein [Candidatus Thiodictyon syntrophicum]AUB82815.1 sulfatase-modifying factor protein [Candidatus Thiodictyon syntrophicum]
MLLDPSPPLFPADWAIAWGEDAYGLWQACAIAGVRQVMRWCPPGRFLMGSPTDEPERFEDETQHEVTLTRGFWLAETACTQGLWQAVTSDNPSHCQRNSEHPVERVTWSACQDFLDRANRLRDDGLVLRLPTEAEWECACRAGTRTAFSFGDALDTGRANYNSDFPYNQGPKGEQRRRTLPVRSFAPNPWGLYQMHGNVWEWCADWFGDYPARLMSDPTGPADGTSRVLRGGAWNFSGRRLRSACRRRHPPSHRRASIGLRLAGD